MSVYRTIGPLVYFSLNDESAIVNSIARLSLLDMSDMNLIVCA